jgi:hypothetical protein
LDASLPTLAEDGMDFSNHGALWWWISVNLLGRMAVLYRLILMMYIFCTKLWWPLSVQHFSDTNEPCFDFDRVLNETTSQNKNDTIDSLWIS